MSANTNYFIWRILGIICYPLFLLYTHLRYRKRVHRLTLVVYNLSRCRDRETRARIARAILEMLYKDYGTTKEQGVFDDAAVAYLIRKSPWLGMRWNSIDRVLAIATDNGDATFEEGWQYAYYPELSLTDDSIRSLNAKIRSQATRMDLLHQENKMVTALLIYFIMLSIRNRY